MASSTPAVPSSEVRFPLTRVSAYPKKLRLSYRKGVGPLRHVYPLIDVIRAHQSVHPIVNPVAVLPLRVLPILHPNPLVL